MSIHILNFETLKVSQKGALAQISLNRPEARNSLNQKLRLELKRALDSAMSDDSIRVILLSGEGKGFCSGADLSEEHSGSDDDGFVTEMILNEYAPIIAAITEGPKPVIGIINGTAAGIGVAVAMACDLLVMAEDASIYCAFGAIGLVPDGGLHVFLRDALGSKRAYEMIALSQRLSAQECKDLGIANRVVPLEEIQQEAETLGKQLSNQAPLMLKYSKQLLGEAADNDLNKLIDREAAIQEIMVRSEDFNEGTLAFFEKRQPLFSGKV